MAKPYFSIIIPTLNEEKYLGYLCDDLLLQSCKDFEVIVSDGHSEDNTLAVVEKYRKKFAAMHSVQNSVRHVCVQRNKGAAIAGGKWLIFMDADDRLPAYFLLGIKYHLESDPADIATTFIGPDRMYKQSDAIIQAMNIAVDIAKNTSSPLINEGMFIISKQLFSELGGFDTNAHYAEGRWLLEKAKRKGYSYKVYKDPVFEYSMRRIRRYGLLRIMKSLAKYEISRLLSIPMTQLEVNRLYPMDGGAIARMPYRKRRQFQVKVQSFVKQMRSPDINKEKLKKLLSELTQNQLHKE